MEHTIKNQNVANALLIFLRWPEPGAVKTRLARDIGDQEAAEVYRRLAESTLDAARALANRCRTVTFYTPQERGKDIERWVGPDFEYVPQIEGDLGSRMAAAFRYVFEAGAGCAVIIGTDCPFITPDLLDRSFHLLDENDIVIGPAKDGGYYLLGMKVLRKELFEGIPWSSSEVFPTTLDRIRRAGWSCAQLPELFDVDRVEDLRAWELTK